MTELSDGQVVQASCSWVVAGIGWIPVGSRGVVVHVYERHDDDVPHYEVEFSPPFHCVETVRVDQIVPAAEPVQGNEGSEGTEIAPEPVPASPGWTAAEIEAVDWQPWQPPDVDSGTEELRACIEAVRDASIVLAANLDIEAVARALWVQERVLQALGKPAYSAPCLGNTDAAIRLIPSGWTVEICGIEGAVGGAVGWLWSVTLRDEGRRIAVGEAPHLPSAITEACLAAAITISAQAKDASAIGLER